MVSVQEAVYEDFGDDAQNGTTETGNLELINDIPLQVTVELGRTHKSLQEVMEHRQRTDTEKKRIRGRRAKQCLRIVLLTTVAAFALSSATLAAPADLVDSLLKGSDSQALRIILELTMDDLLEKVRQSLSRVITSRFLSGDDAGMLTLDSGVEQLIAEHTRKTESGKMTILEPAQMKLLLVNTKTLADQLTMEGKKTVVLTSPVIRQNFKHLIEQAMPDVTVLSYTEIQQNYEIQIAGVITMEKRAG